MLPVPWIIGVSSSVKDFWLVNTRGFTFYECLMLSTQDRIVQHSTRQCSTLQCNAAQYLLCSWCIIHWSALLQLCCSSALEQPPFCSEEHPVSHLFESPAEASFYLFQLLFSFPLQHEHIECGGFRYTTSVLSCVCESACACACIGLYLFSV